MVRYVPTHDSSCPDFQDDKHVEQAERGRDDDKEITGEHRPAWFRTTVLHACVAIRGTTPTACAGTGFRRRVGHVTASPTRSALRDRVRLERGFETEAEQGPSMTPGSYATAATDRNRLTDRPEKPTGEIDARYYPVGSSMV